MNVNFRDPAVIRESLKEQERVREYERERERVRKDWKWTVCDCCGQINCICGCKEAQMESRY